MRRCQTDSQCSCHHTIATTKDQEESQELRKVERKGENETMRLPGKPELPVHVCKHVFSKQTLADTPMRHCSGWWW